MWLIYLCRVFITTTLLLLFQKVLLQECYGCLQEERMALLKLKAYWCNNNPNANFVDALASWNSKDKDRECCDWERVRCDYTTGRVTELDLSNTREFIKQDYYGRLYSEQASPMYLNATLFLSFQELHTLDLSRNELYGTIKGEELKMLNKLESLYLARNQLNAGILDSVGKLSRLKNLDLSRNHMNGSLVSNNISLGLCRLKRLEMLDLSSNNLEGVLPPCLGNLTSLRDLDLSSNRFVGNIASSPLVNLVSLEDLDLSSNQFKSLSPFSSLNIGTSFPNLQTLDLSNNSFHGEIPSSIGNKSLLTILNLSNNNLSGEIPENFVRGCTSLAVLALSNNQLHGQISPLIFNMTSLKNLYLDSNHFTRLNIPQSLSLSLPSINGSNDLEVLDVRDNNMSELPNRLGNMMTLRELHMSKNHIRGPLPETLCSLQLLQILDLSNNNITGHIPSCFNPPFIGFVNLRRNGLTRSFMNDDNNVLTKNSSELVALDLGDNNLSGGISSNINGSFLKLRILILKGNHLQGPIPKQLCHLYQISMMDLSFNNLSGPIPSCLANLTFELTEDALDFDVLLRRHYMQSPNEEYVEFTTKRRTYMYQGEILRYVSGIDLSSNQLTGTIPHEIGKIGQIYTLNLSHNRLTGTIPSTFEKLDSVESLDLSYNNLSGSIPLALVQLSSLEVFSVAHNNLTGKTPDRKAQFATFDESSYEGNPFLCGLPLNKSCTVTTATEEEEEEEEDSSSINFVVFFGSFTASYVMGFIGVIVVLYLNPYWRRVWFHMVDEWIWSIDYFLLVMYYKLKHFVRA